MDKGDSKGEIYFKNFNGLKAKRKDGQWMEEVVRRCFLCANILRTRRRRETGYLFVYRSRQGGH